jgi:hypothetical protein
VGNRYSSAARSSRTSFRRACIRLSCMLSSGRCCCARASTRAARACSSASSGCRMPMNIRAWARSARCGSAVDLRRVGVRAAVSQPGSSARLCSAGWMCGVWQQPHVAHAPGSSAELKSRTTTRDLTCYRASRRSAPAMACVQAKRSGRGWFSWLASATARAPLPRARKSVALCSA